MKNVVGRISLWAVCLLVLFQVSCDDNDKLEAFLDNQKPSVATGLQTSELGPEGLVLQWNAADDNVAVTAYEVFQNGTLIDTRSEEHTSELQSRENLVCRL